MAAFTPASPFTQAAAMSSELVYTPIDDIVSIRNHVRASFRAGKAKSVAFRKEQLLQLAYLIQDNTDRFQAALKNDLGRPVVESNLFDISAMITEALHSYKNVDAWVKPDKAPFDSTFFAFSPKVHKEPKGVALIISPFNYPLWCLTPITGAIAAGCAVVIKPSELTPATSQLLAELFPKYLDPDLYRVVNGAVAETTQLLALQWDHILYTGSGRVGRIVATAAARHLTPVTLELGGKSPVLIDANADFELTARRLLWGKMMNSGQTCTAPDYVLVTEPVQKRLVEALKAQWTKFYGGDPRTSGSFSRICAHSHWERIAGLLAETKGEVVLGGDTDRADKYIAPTVVQNVSFSDSLMSEELFGPILAIVPVPSMDAALEYVNNHDAPLALYVFSKDAKFRAHVRANTLSGMFVENDVVVQGGSSITPFGGVGPSGYGSHKGKYSFDTFVHHRSSFNSPKWIDSVEATRFPPYTGKVVTNANALVPSIPYPRPGAQKPPTKWGRWAFLSLAFALIAANRQRIVALVKGAGA
ncbi:aldehyde dehydrogenase [Gautieria morchelliformis]|nr:aldehyde dehydrogenase [Gautieria morchelliformis]